MTPKEALKVYNEITGEGLTNPYLITAGMERRGFPIGKNFNKRRIILDEADVRAYAADKLARPKLPVNRLGEITAGQATALYRKLTGKSLVKQHTIIDGMERRGFPVQRKYGRITVTEADVRAYAQEKLATPRKTKPGRGITLTGSRRNAPKNKKQKSTLEAVANVAKRQGFEAVQRNGYVELVPGKKHVAREPEFDFDFNRA